MIEYEFSPTGVLYRNQSHLQDTFTLKVDTKNKLIQQIDPLPNSLFKPFDGWKKTNEPEEHLDEIAEKISTEVKNPKILCFSYKDESLAKRLKPKNEKHDILFDEDYGIIKKSPDEISFIDFKKAINVQLQNYNLFIVRHYLEHFSRAEELLCSLAEEIKKIEDIYAYIEVPDCGKFIQKKNPLFLWEQHKVYFTNASLRNQLNESKISIMHEGSYGSSIEPSLCYLVCKENNNGIINTEKENSDIKNNLKKLNEYAKKWNEYLRKQKIPKILYGIGHNSDRFLQFTKTNRCFDYFVDGDLAKKDLYLAKTDKAIANYIPLSHDCAMEIIIGVHDRNYEAVSTKVKTEYPNARISSIFSYPKQ